MAFSTATAALVIYNPGVTASLAGFALSFSLQYNNAISMFLKQYANTELNMNPTERVIEYSQIEIEDQGGLSPPAAWPTDGRLGVHDLTVSYAPNLPPVLHGLTFSAVNQRVGVVGRTGAGKSTLSLARCSGFWKQDGVVFTLTESTYRKSNCTICAAGWRLFLKTLFCSLERSGRTLIHSTSTANSKFSTPWRECI